MSLSKSVAARGKRLLMEAAMRLAASTRSLSALSLREVAREAGLNPNTFYRHFKNFDELGLAIIQEMSNEIRQPLRDLRRQAAESVIPANAPQQSWEDNPKLNLLKSMQVNKATVALFFDYVVANPNAFILGVRELHGASPRLRQALRIMMHEFAEDIAGDIKALNLLPEMDEDYLFDIAEIISREMFLLSMDYIEHEDKRPQICAKAERMIISLSTGVAVLRGHGSVLTSAFSTD